MLDHFAEQGLDLLILQRTNNTVACSEVRTLFLLLPVSL